MEILRESSDDKSRPASTDRASCRVRVGSLPHIDRTGSTTPLSVVVLTNDAADNQIQRSSEETMSDISSAPDMAQRYFTEEELKDLELMRAFEEMRRLDEILSKMVFREKEAERQRKELQATLWEDFRENKPDGLSECTQEELHTRGTQQESPVGGAGGEDDFVPVFTTQPPECEHNRYQNVEQSEMRPNSATESFEIDREQTREEQFGGIRRGSSKCKNKQTDFVNRNIELVRGVRDHVLLSQSEKERLAELLREIDEEEEDGARGADSEGACWAESVLTGQGYTPHLSDLEQLIDIDSKIHHLHPVEDVLSSTSLSLTEDPGSEVGLKFDGDLQPREKVLQVTKERKGLERRLQEIQEQLEILCQGQEMTNESPDLTEEQLLGLLDEGKQTDSWSQDLEPYDTTL